jgi:hypothetical protein
VADDYWWTAEGVVHEPPTQSSDGVLTRLSCPLRCSKWTDSFMRVWEQDIGVAL